LSYTYHISLNGSDYTEVFPSNAIEVTTEREDDVIFHRDKVNDVVLSKVENTTIFASLETYFTTKANFNDQLEFEIYDGVRTGTAFYKGLFSISDCTLDKELKTITIPIRTNDRYREVLEVYEVADYNSFISRVIAGDYDTISSWIAGSPEEADVGTGINDFDTWTQSDNYTITNIENNSGGSPEAQARHYSLGNISYTAGEHYYIYIYVSAYTKGTGDDLRMRVYDDADSELTSSSEDVITGTGWYGLEVDSSGTPAYFVLVSTGPGDWSITFQPFIASNLQFRDSACLPITGTNSFVTNALDNLSITIDSVSTFFYNDSLPSDAPSTIDTWITSNPNGNYVTEDTTNHFENPAIGAGETWGERAQVTPPKWSLKQIMDYLRDIFDVHWYIDDDGDFRVEHKKYFEKLYDDSTAITVSGYSDYKPETDSLSYAFRKELIYAREEFTQGQNTSDADFVGEPIIYDVFETSPEIKKYNNSHTADLNYLTGDNGSKSGMVIYDTVSTDIASGGSYIVKFTTGVLSSTAKKNAYLSWANLHSNFWSWGRMSENLNVNGSDTTADSVAYFLEQEGVKFHYPNAIPWYNKVTGSLGDAKILSMTRDLDSDFVTFKLGYNPYE